MFTPREKSELALFGLGGLVLTALLLVLFLPISSGPSVLAAAVLLPFVILLAGYSQVRQKARQREEAVRQEELRQYLAVHGAAEDEAIRVLSAYSREHKELLVRDGLADWWDDLQQDMPDRCLSKAQEFLRDGHLKAARWLAEFVEQSGHPLATAREQAISLLALIDAAAEKEGPISVEVVRFRCTACGKRLRAKGIRGERAKCPSCGRPLGRVTREHSKSAD